MVVLKACIVYISWTTPGVLVFCVISACGILLVLLAAILIVQNRNNKVLRRSSPIIMGLQLAGLFFIFIYIYFGLGEPGRACFLNILPLPIGFALVMGYFSISRKG